MLGLNHLYCLTFLGFALFVQSCNKDDIDGGVPQVVFEKQDYYSYEVARLEVSNLDFTEDQYSAYIGSTALQLIPLGGSLITSIPELSEGIHELLVSINGTSYAASFNVLPAPTISDPNIIFNQFIESGDASNDFLLQYADSLNDEDRVLWLATIQTIRNFRDSTYQLYSVLLPEEKENCARFLLANRVWIDELNLVVNVMLNQSFSLKPQDSQVDYEKSISDRVSAYLTENTKVKLMILGKIGGLAVVAGLIASKPTFGFGFKSGAVVGGMIGFYWAYQDIMSLVAAKEELFKKAIQPGQELLSMNKTHDILTFSNLSYTSITVTLGYRSIYSADVNSSIPLIRNIVVGVRELASAWNTITHLLPTSMQFSFKTVDAIQTYITRFQPVHSKYLTVSHISNSKVQLEGLDKSNGYMKIKFTTDETSQQSFSFRINYKSVLGQSSQNVNAELNVDELSSITDVRDGKVYKIVDIGNQTWFAENLRYSGSIPQVASQSVWNSMESQAWCYYANSSANDTIYGKLYNWYAVNTEGLCPAGWHVPTNEEWDALIGFLGGGAVAGGKMKSTGTQYWQSPNLGATNESGFSALPGGMRNSNGSFVAKGTYGYWWSSTEKPIYGSWDRNLGYNNGEVGFGDDGMNGGYSVRCIKN